MVVIGTDVPDISAGVLRAAFVQLGTTGHQAVLGPAFDGGYYLLGLRGSVPRELFQVCAGWGRLVCRSVRRCSGSSGIW